MIREQFQLNGQTKMKYEPCYYDYYVNDNNKVFEHSFHPGMASSANSRKDYIDSTSVRGILQDNNFDISGNTIDQSTVLRNGTNAGLEDRKELDTRVFPGAPYMAAGQSILKNPDLSSRLLYGEDTRVAKSNNVTTAYSANNFIPLIPTIKDNVQNPEHLIPTFWVRGGMSTRTVVRNIDYLQACGLKKN